ncbi:MarR family winged helix-turn-helix transcriptional regulator [Actinopolymorpha singaporensis]
MDNQARLDQALADLRHGRYGFYGAALRDQMLSRLSIPLTARRYRLLRAVQMAGPSGLSLTQVADVMQCDQARATRLVDVLQERGLVSRRMDASDHRQRRVHPTEAGSTLLDEAEDVRRAYLRHVLTGWPAGDVATFADLLTRFNLDVQRHQSLPLEGLPVNTGNEDGRT